MQRFDSPVSSSHHFAIMPLPQVNSVDMDHRLLRNYFAHVSSFKDAMRTPVEYIPTYATLFGANDKPATFILLLTWVLFLYGLMAHHGPLARRKAKATHTIRCLLVVIALAISINLPISSEDLWGSTFRCYAIILVFLLQMHLFGRRSGIKECAFVLHILVGVQIALLPDFWSKTNLSLRDPAGGIFFFMISWAFLGISAVATSQKDSVHFQEIELVRKKVEEEKAVKKRAAKKEAAEKKAAAKEAAKKQKASKRAAAKEHIKKEVASSGYITIEKTDKMGVVNTNAVKKAVKDNIKSEEECKVASGSRQPLQNPFTSLDDYVPEEIEMVDRRQSQASLDQMQKDRDEGIVGNGKSRAVDDVRIDMDMVEEMSDGFTAVESEHESVIGEKQHQDKKEEVSKSDGTSIVAHNEQQGSQSSRDRSTTTEVIAVQPEEVIEEKRDEPVYEYGLSIGFFILCFLDCLAFTLLHFL